MTQIKKLTYLLVLTTTFTLFNLTVVRASPAKFATNPSFHGEKIAEVTAPRGLYCDDAGDILVVSRTPSLIIALYETTQMELDGTIWIEVNQTLIVNGTGLNLNHGITYNSGYLYASSDSTVYRWPYIPGQRTQITDDPEIVIYNIPAGGSHVTRTLIFDSQSRLYVSIGAGTNVDPDSERARIRQFESESLNELPPGGINFVQGHVFADGLRNEVALDFDDNDILYGVENGVGNNLNRPDLGGDILAGNPSEEFNKFDGELGTHYGYPYCFSSYDLDGYEIGTQFVMPEFWTDGIHSDDWCRQSDNNRAPIFHLPAHSAPLGLEFYRGDGCDEAEGAFPCSMVGDAFISLHGSNYIKIGAEEGYSVALFPMNQTSGAPTGQILNVIFAPNITHCDGTCFRPVNAIFNKNGHLIVSADKSNEIFRVTYNQQEELMFD